MSDEHPGFPPAAGPPADPQPDSQPGPFEPGGREPLPPASWAWWEPVVLFLLVFVTAGVLAGVVVAVVGAETPKATIERLAKSVSNQSRLRAAELTDRNDLLRALQIVTFAGSVALWSLLWPFLRHRATPRALGMRGDRFGGDVAFGLGWGLAAWALATIVVGNVTLWIADALKDGKVRQPDQLDLADPSGAVLALTGFGVVVLAPLAEELFFRGFVFRGFRRVVGAVGGTIVSAVLFTAAHAPLWLIFPSIFTLGIFLAWMFERRASLVPCIAAHMVFNAIGFALLAGGLD